MTFWLELEGACGRQLVARHQRPKLSCTKVSEKLAARVFLCSGSNTSASIERP